MKPKLVLSMDKKEGLLKRITSYLIFYEEQTVFSFLAKERQKEESEKISKKIKEEGKGFFKGSAEMMRFWSHYGEKFFEYSPEEVIDGCEKNFSIQNRNIEKMIFKKLDVGMVDSNGNSNARDGKFTFEANGEKYQFIHKYGKDRNIVNVLQHLFGSNVKFK